MTRKKIGKHWFKIDAVFSTKKKQKIIQRMQEHMENKFVFKKLKEDMLFGEELEIILSDNKINYGKL